MPKEDNIMNSSNESLSVLYSLKSDEDDLPPEPKPDENPDPDDEDGEGFI